MIACFNPDPSMQKAMFYVVELELKHAISHSLKLKGGLGRALLWFLKAIILSYSSALSSVEKPGQSGRRRATPR